MNHFPHELHTSRVFSQVSAKIERGTIPQKNSQFSNFCFTIETPASVDTPVSVETPASVDTPVSVDTSDSIETPDSVDKSDSVDTPDSI